MTRLGCDAWRWCVVMLPVLVMGCSSGSGRVPASGQVLIDGKPLTTGTVMVAPTDDRPAFGKLDSEGRFTLTTEDEGDGCIVGTHRVTVTATEMVDPNHVRHLIPAHYADLAYSDLTVTVDGPTEELSIELSWGGGGPKTIRVHNEGDVDPGAM